MPVKPTPAIERVLRRCAERGECWEFLGALSQGYGVVGRGPRGTGTALTHRVTYEFFVGEVPDGLDLDHLCRNRACCNPWHLEPVTRKVNVARGLRAPGYAAGITHCRNGHEYTEANTYIAPRAGHRVCRSCRLARREPQNGEAS